MKTMPFPKEYKKVLQHGRKNVTIRIQQEVGRYRRGQIYQATDYKGNPFNIEIKILDVIKVPLSKARRYIPDAELNRPEFKSLSPDAKIELIKFISRSAEPNPIDVKLFGLKTDEGKVKLNRQTAEALIRANKDLPPKYELSIISGYRSPHEQAKIVKDMEKKLKQTNPHNWEELLKKYTGGYEELHAAFSFMDHRSGNAVDLKIVHNNEEVNLGGQMNDERDQLNYYEKPKLTEEEEVIKHNRRWLKKVLEKHGFKNNPDEWWHWGYEPKW